MNFIKDVLNSESQVDIEDFQVVKTYYSLPKQHWIRIRDSALVLSDHGIGPQVMELLQLDDEMSITFEKVVPFSPEEEPEEEFKLDELISNIRKVVKKMHLLGWAHGDLHLGNLGHTQGDIYDVKILDTDTMYKTETKEYGKWLLDWIKEGYDLFDEHSDKSVKEVVNIFANYDYTNWDSDWLDV
jgi:hypothetical protein